MRTRLALLLITVVALVLPWAGLQLVQQLEAILREGQEQAQRSATEALAGAVAASVDRLPDLGHGLFVVGAARAPLLDGAIDDWAEAPANVGANGRLAIHLISSGSALFALVEVKDASRARADVGQPYAPAGDAVLIELTDAVGVQRWKIGNAAPGPLVAMNEVEGEAPVSGQWQETSDGYRLELRLPKPLPSARLAITLIDADPKSRQVQRLPWADPGDEPPLLISHDTELDRLLTRFTPAGARLRLTSADAFVLGQAGSIERLETGGDDDGSGRPLGTGNGAIRPPTRWRAALYRLLFAPPPEASEAYAADRLRLDVPIVWQALSGVPASSVRASTRASSVIVAAAAPVMRNGQPIAALVLEQPSAALLVLADRAVFGVMAATLFVVVLSVLAIVAYAGLLRFRIRRLRDAAERALRPDGRLDPRLPHLGAGDDLGDLSRSFARLLGEVGGHNDYLKTLASKLSHELNTPLAIVRSSLDNLDHVELGGDARTYADRARAGAERLSGILRSMAEASRMERAIANAEGEDFDLAEMLRHCAESYRDLLAPRRLELTVPAVPLRFYGAPELIAQALDKLVDNARSFTPPDGWVRITLEADDVGVRIGVANQGSKLPEKLGARMFESLVSTRPESTGDRPEAPHLGLGLYIVRLIAELHGGMPAARNLPDGSGVEFELGLVGMKRAV